jgi:hypothetical protein
MFRWTTKAQRNTSARTRNALDFSPGDQFATNKAIPFLIQDVPLPKMIESPQDKQFLCMG